MARLFVAALVIIIPAVLAAPSPSKKSEKKGRSQYLPQGLGITQGLTASGATGVDYGQTQVSNENHDKKNFGVNYSSDKGSSNNFSQTGLQAAATGGLAQAQVPQYVTAPYAPAQYPGYPYQYYPQYYPGYQYPSYYPQYAPVYHGAGVANLGVGSNVNLPGGVSASSVGAVQGGIRSPVDGGIRYPVEGGIRSPVEGKTRYPIEFGMSPVEGGIRSPNTFAAPVLGSNLNHEEIYRPY